MRSCSSKVTPIYACVKGRSLWISFIRIRYGATPPMCPPFRRNGMRVFLKAIPYSWPQTSVLPFRGLLAQKGGSFLGLLEKERRVLGFFYAPKLPYGNHGIRAVLINTRANPISYLTIRTEGKEDECLPSSSVSLWCNMDDEESEARALSCPGSDQINHRSVYGITFYLLPFPSLSSLTKVKHLACYKLGLGTAVSSFPCSHELVLDKSDLVFIIWSKRIRTFACRYQKLMPYHLAILHMACFRRFIKLGEKRLLLTVNHREMFAFKMKMDEQALEPGADEIRRKHETGHYTGGRQDMTTT
ncbi:hypothetical protein LWI28_012504 [Acer negundo]|uniref:Uncharacterized protein n=1 Tax=Acer negundo TaxID=4023 RepID=A0AAD5JD91_ACENE|nr:hypothetical protein LWI28_012504 [Acer negundo]